MQKYRGYFIAGGGAAAAAKRAGVSIPTRSELAASAAPGELPDEREAGGAAAQARA